MKHFKNSIFPTYYQEDNEFKIYPFDKRNVTDDLITVFFYNNLIKNVCISLFWSFIFQLSLVFPGKRSSKEVNPFKEHSFTNYCSVKTRLIYFMNIFKDNSLISLLRIRCTSRRKVCTSKNFKLNVLF